MKKETKKVILAASTMVGLIIGVGIFGVPYAISQLGWPLALAMFVGLGAVQILLLRFLAEVSIVTEDGVRFPGLVKRHLGPRYKTLASVAWTASSWSAMIAYVLLGGQFLHTLVSPALGGSVITYQVGWAAVGFLLLSLNLSWVSRINFVATIVMVLALFGVAGMSLADVDISGMTTEVTGILMPYGVILFALSGLGSVTEMEDLSGGSRENYRRSILLGFGLSWLLTLVFGFAVYAVTGAATTTDAIAGLQIAIGGPLPYIAALCGFFAVATSFIIGGEDLTLVFENDFGFRPYVAWLITITVPTVIFALGAREFMPVISFSATVFGGVIAALVTLMFARLKKRGQLSPDVRLPAAAAWIVGGAMLLGAVIEVVETVRGWVG